MKFVIFQEQNISITTSVKLVWVKILKISETLCHICCCCCCNTELFQGHSFLFLVFAHIIVWHDINKLTKKEEIIVDVSVRKNGSGYF